MGKIRHLAWLFCFLFVCVLLLLASSNQAQNLVGAHGGLASYVFLALFLAIPGSFVTLGSAYAFEALLAGSRHSSLRKLWDGSASVRLDLISVAMTLLPLRYAGYVLSLGLLYVVDTHALRPANVSMTRLLPTWGLQVACLVLFQSFISYWIHRLEHSVPALWALHKFHHSADRMALVTADRQTELTKGVEQLLLFVFLAVLSEPTAAKPGADGPLFVLVALYFAFRAFRGVNQYLCHSNLTTDYGWVGRWLLVSPRMHRLHHATSPRYHNTNFTFDFVIWDRLFGTYASCDAAAVNQLALGLDDNPFNTGGSLGSVLRAYLITPYLEFWRAASNGLPAWLPTRSDPNPAAPAAGQRSGMQNES